MALPQETFKARFCNVHHNPDDKALNTKPSNLNCPTVPPCMMSSIIYRSSFKIQYESRHSVICACKSEQVDIVCI